jgi:hypothetical protein
MRVPFSWWTWGELIVVVFHDGTAKIESKCSPKIQLMDWGKNQGNINLVAWAITHPIESA